MKFMLLIHNRSAGAAAAQAWDRLSDDEKNAVYADYKAINETPGVTPGPRLEDAEGARTVRVKDGATETAAGGFPTADDALSGYLVFEADDFDAAIELAARVPAARMGGAVEVRPLAGG
jgi:hypothetical protein